MKRWDRWMTWAGSLDPRIVDAVLTFGFAAFALVSVFTQELTDGYAEPGALAVVTTIVTCSAVALRRRSPFVALMVGCAGITVHIFLDQPEGALPIVLLFLTYWVAAWDTPRRSLAGLGVIFAVLVVIAAADTPGLDAVGAVANAAFFSVAWAIGFALRARRETLELRVSEAEERANVERQRAGRLLAEERLRIAQELHDVVAHSMSVIAVQAGAGAHVLDSRPDQAREALDAISATSRGTLAELRRLLGVLRDSDGERSHAPAPALVDLPQLVADVRAAGVPVALDVEGSSTSVNPAMELSAYRIVQEALTNVIKHAGAPSRVDVHVRYLDDSLEVEVRDDGRGAATNGTAEVAGHGLLGMRERVTVWGGELAAGPAAGGGFGVRALLPYGEST